MNPLFLILIFFISSCASAQTDNDTSCSQDPQRLEARSKELAQIVKADQDDREDFQSKTPEEMQDFSVNSFKSVAVDFSFFFGHKNPISTHISP